MQHASAPFGVGLIGLGAMGLLAAEQLIGAGVTARGYLLGVSTDFDALNGISVIELSTAAVCDPLILLLPSDEALLQATPSARPNLRDGQIVTSLGTSSVRAKQEDAAIAASAGAILLEGEVSGTRSVVRAGQASVLVAGDDDAIAILRPILSTIAAAVTRCAHSATRHA